MLRISGFVCSALVLLVLSIASAPASAALEGVRDCQDVRSTPWKHFLGGSSNDEYRGNEWFVLAGVGMKPTCEFARKWARIGVKQAVRPIGAIYDRPLRGRYRPAGWSCFVQNTPRVVKTTGGILDCQLFNRRGRLIGSFSAGPDFDEQVGPF